MPRQDGTGPYWGGGPRAGFQKGLCGPDVLATKNVPLLVALGLGALVLAYIVFSKKR